MESMKSRYEQLAALFHSRGVPYKFEGRIRSKRLKANKAEYGLMFGSSYLLLYKRITQNLKESEEKFAKQTIDDTPTHHGSYRRIICTGQFIVYITPRLFHHWILHGQGFLMGNANDEDEDKEFNLACEKYGMRFHTCIEGNANDGTKPASTSAKTGTSTRATNGAESVAKENTNNAGSRASTSSSNKKVESTGTGTGTGIGTSTRGGTKPSLAEAMPSPMETDSQPPSSANSNSHTSTRKKARKEDVTESLKSNKKAKATSQSKNISHSTVPSLIPARSITRDPKPSRPLTSPDTTSTSTRTVGKRGTNILPSSSKPAPTTNSKAPTVEKDGTQSSPEPNTAKTQRGRARKIQLYCTILRIDEVTAASIADGKDTINSVKECGLTRNIGFITIQDRSCTFADAREIMIRDLDVELPSESSDDCLPSNFNFCVPHLGPMSREKESKLGPMLDFFGADGDMDEDERKRVVEQFGDGSKRNPLKVIVCKSK